MSPEVRQECQRTADTVGYVVPCPTYLPTDTRATPSPAPGCRFAIIAAWGPPRCKIATQWRGWIFGTSQDQYEHLVLQGAPRVVRNPTRAIDGPGPLHRAHVQPRGTTTIAGHEMRWYYVSPKTNDGSAYMHHLVLVWTTSGHTYAYGFHLVTTIADTRALDRELVSHLSYVKPHNPSH